MIIKYFTCVVVCLSTHQNLCTFVKHDKRILGIENLSLLKRIVQPKM